MRTRFGIIKLVLVFLWLSIFCLPLIAGDYWTVDSDHKQITAFKRLKPEEGQAEKEYLEIRIVNPNDKDVAYESEVSLSERSTEVEDIAFSYVLYGNLYRNLVVSFSFGPLCNRSGGLLWNEEPKSSDKVIPYDVRMEHTITRIGNTLIGTTDRTAENTAGQLPIKYNYKGTEYSFYYADSIAVGEEKSINRSSSNIDIAYSMEPNSYVVNYPSEATVCSYWNRYGTAYIKLNLPNSATDGVYLANVIVTITTGA